MARSANPLQRDDIGIVARSAGVLTGPSTNSAIQLAEALRDLAPEAAQTARLYANDQKKKQGALAARDAIIASGAPLADAVREGKIAPTQNPWYVKAYEREGSAVRSQTALAKLQTDSTSWAEQSDPAAFAAKWRESVGEIAKQYKTEDEIAGFAPVEGQFTQQTLAANQSKNTTRIIAERQANLGALAGNALEQAMHANGGVLTTANARAALDPAYQQWRGTGGSDAEWNKMAISAITTASYSTRDPSLLDLLKDPALLKGAPPPAEAKGVSSNVGLSAQANDTPAQPVPPALGTSLYDLPGVAEAASTDRYRIMQNREFEATSRLREIQAKVKTDGLAASDKLWATHGTALLTGTIDSQTLIKEMTADGTSPQAIAEALNTVRGAVGDVVALQSARIAANATNPEMARRLLDLRVEGLTRGLTPGYVSRVGDEVLAGHMSQDDGAQMVASAVSRSRSLVDQNRSDINFAQSQEAHAKAASSEAAGYKAIGRTTDNWAAMATTRLTGAGIQLKPQVHAAIRTQVKDAARAWLALHPQDFAGADTAARNQAGVVAMKIYQAARPKPKPTTSGGPK